MNWTTMALGLAMIAFGVVTAVLRQTRPQVFRKLEPMKRAWGPRAGLGVHIVGYTIVPIVAGAIFVYNGVHGFSVFH